MRHWLLLFALFTAPAVAGDDLDAMNAASQAWDRYAQLGSRDDPAAADLLAGSTLRHYGFLRDAALVASAEQVRRLPLSDRVFVYVLRAKLDGDRLAALDDRDIARLCVREGWCGVASPAPGEAVSQLSHVTLIASDRAVGELGPPTGTQFQFGPELAREAGAWKVMAETLALDESTGIQHEITRSGMSETQMLQFIVARLAGGEGDAPPLAVLDRPLRDDATARTRLNETWPRYEDGYRARVTALEKKAADGDSLAQFALGSLLYSGALPAIAPKDSVRALQLLEQASDAGNAQAAAAVIQALTQDYTPAKGKPVPADTVAKLARHTRRAAEGGVGPAMAHLGGLIFNGAGGNGRDCQQAEEWSARAEDAGVTGARNDRVWFLATCPIAAQRDPKRAMALAGHMIAQADTLSYAELDTVAAALAANGRFDEAVHYQQRAIAGLPQEATDTRRRMRQRLAVYQRRHDWVQDYNAYEQPVL
ncbi:hypothetical protein ACFOLC_06220 [Lysobacter cavernae]|uniref:Sel1 repeat family protein n=1 Tax=Lysobacter cavernae TaxID=1685901 RepID=A0ABV7RLV1_9GAMM